MFVLSPYVHSNPVISFISFSLMSLFFLFGCPFFFLRRRRWWWWRQLGVDVIEAVERNDVAGVKSYIAGKGDLNQKGKNDMTPLHVASFNGRTDIVG